MKNALRGDEQLRRQPVIVLATSAEQQNTVNSLNLGVAVYMAKPINYRQLVQMMRHIDQYWTRSELP
ncbi:hypothetical protein [Bordetella sp. FB-8]|uniref:hypothetical protein n=1 Tax=Bordetella sp. FB-8 TaxID=1159870 RepID=UPI00037CB02E|nr:hypothetical protein [Bordetella sp. FB-8]